MNNDEEILENETLDDDQEIPEEQAPTEVESETVNSEEQSIEMVNPAKGKGLADLQALKKLFNIKAKLIIAVAVISLIAILFFSILMSDELKVKYDYIEPKCTEIQVHFKHREDEDLNLKLEDYVKSMVYSLTKDMDHPERVLYQAIAIIVRTNAQSLSSCTLEITDEVDEFYDFEILENNNKRYLEIARVVDEYVPGLVMIDNNQIMNVDFDAFCYQEQSDEFYTIYNDYNGPDIPTSWVKDEIEESRFRNCPCKPGKKRSTTQENSCWVEEKFSYGDDEDENGNKITWYRYVDGGDSGNGFSVYTAYYLADYPGYNDDQIIRFFYPGEWNYRTILKEKAAENNNSNTSYGGIGCMWWPIGSNETTLSDGKIFASGLPASIRVTSSFGNRNQPTAGASTNHKAIDIGGPHAGAEEGIYNIIAVSNGTVVKANGSCVSGVSNCGSGLGNYVTIQHENGLETRYGHMYSITVQVGEQVKQGQVIGKMGNTGTSTATHLDFQIKLNGEAVNPLNYVSVSNTRPTNCFHYTPGASFTGIGSKAFIEFIAPYAVEEMKRSNILASVIIAQAGLESYWGKSGLSKKYHNYFGMKAGKSWTGKTVVLPTTECSGNNCYKTTATWRVYDNPLESLQDHSKLLSGKGYNKVIGEKDYYTALTIIKNGGYATDPNYVSKLASIIKNNNLTKYDNM